MKIRYLIPGKIKSYIRRKVLQNEPGRFYYSQHGEDLIVRVILESYRLTIENGFYVDIGAYHPTNFSNTLFFYMNGWSGINIDPCPGSMNLFNKLRNRDINLEIGVSEKVAIRDYYFFNQDSPMNSFSKEFIDEIKAFNLVKKVIPIATYPLSEIFDKHLPESTPIDYMNIDVEGLDLEVINSNNWNKYRPKIISVEIDNITFIDDLVKSDIYNALLSLQYNCVAKNVVTRNIATVFFVDNKILV